MIYRQRGCTNDGWLARMAAMLLNLAFGSSAFVLEVEPNERLNERLNEKSNERLKPNDKCRAAPHDGTCEARPQ